MSGSMVDSNDEVDSSLLEDQCSTLTTQTASSCVQGRNQQENMKEKSDGYPVNMIGWSVVKTIGMHGLDGVVESYDTETKNFQILYENGKSETVSRARVIKSFYPLPPEKVPPRGSRPLMMRADNHIPRQRRCTGKGKKRARAQNAPAGETATADSGKDEVNKRTKAESAGGSTAPRKAQKRQVQHSPGNI